MLLAVLSPVRADEQSERVAASFVLALGRGPTVAEARQWAGPDVSFADLMAKHRQQLQGDAAAKRTVVAKAFQDAVGRAPTAQEVAADSTGAASYTELVQQHVKRMAGDAGEYAQVLNRVYQLVIRRDVYPEEIEYWKKKRTLSFTVLVGCVDNWGRRNQPGLMVTAGPAAVSINCVFLTTARLSPVAAAEARAAAGLPAVSDPQAGTNLLAAGAEGVATDGRMHFAAASKE